MPVSCANLAIERNPAWSQQHKQLHRPSFFVRRQAMDTRHLLHLLPGCVDICDLILIADQTRFPAHSSYLASQSEFLKQFCLDVGPFSWKAPHVIEKALEGHSSNTVHNLLVGVYSPESLTFTEPWLAWDLYKLADQLHCPSLLKTCEDYLNTTGSSLLAKTAQDALHCLTATAHVSRLSDLHKACASVIAGSYQQVQHDHRMLQLPREAVLLIMETMCAQIVRLEADKAAALIASRKRKRGENSSSDSSSSSSSSESDDESQSESESEYEEDPDAEAS